MSISIPTAGLVLGSSARDDDTIEPLVESLARQCMEQPVVDTGHWQALKDVPQTLTREIRNAVVQVGVHATREAWEAFCCANQPWAERQFQERVAGEPVNPGETYKEWPWYRGNVDAHRKCTCEHLRDDHEPAQHGYGICRLCGCPGFVEEQAKFSHTYMERFWPRVAHLRYHDETVYDLHGIRYRYGDLNDVLDLLAREPYTRQAYLPIFFPEDTGAHHGERIPCTLGYHFMLRDGRLHCFYPIRSCDLLRHFKDDVYMAGRLVQWVIKRLDDKLNERPVQTEAGLTEAWRVGEGDPFWHDVDPGDLTLFIPSLHVFDGDMPALRRKYGA